MRGVRPTQSRRPAAAYDDSAGAADEQRASTASASQVGHRGRSRRPRRRAVAGTRSTGDSRGTSPGGRGRCGGRRCCSSRDGFFDGFFVGGSVGRGSDVADGVGRRRWELVGGGRRAASTSGWASWSASVVGGRVGVGRRRRRGRRRDRRGHPGDAPARRCCQARPTYAAGGHLQPARADGGVDPGAALAVGPAQAPVGVGGRGVDARVVGRHAVDPADEARVALDVGQRVAGRREHRARRPCPRPPVSHTVWTPPPSAPKSTTTLTPDAVEQVAADAGGGGGATPVAAARTAAATRRATRRCVTVCFSCGRVTNVLVAESAVLTFTLRFVLPLGICSLADDLAATGLADQHAWSRP